MTALPPQHALDAISRRSSTRHVVRKTTITHRGPRNGIPSTSFTHIGATAPSSQSSRQLREPQINHQGHRNNDTEAQLRSDFELAFDLAAEAFLDNSTTNQATTVGTLADASRRSNLDPQRIHNSFWANDHEEQLEDRAHITRSKQDEWYNGVLDRSRAREATRRELFRQTKDEWETLARAESEAYHRAHEEELAKRQARLAAEAEQRQNALERERRAREQAIAARQAEEERRRRQEEERRQRLRECAGCLEDQDMLLMIEAPCRHWYCRGDIQNAIEVALESRSPFQCCRTAVPLDNMTGILPEDLHRRYQDLLLELATPNPIYCSNRSCGLFIPPSQVQGPDLAECSRCATATCQHCRNRFHPRTDCPADVATQQTRALATAQGWKACPSCGQIVDKALGCQHMSCRCGTQFCYGCGGFYPCRNCGVY